MRGVVTMAAVLVIPADVPHHDVLVLAALTVVLGTLYLQGLSIPWLVRLLHVQPSDPAVDALARATLLQQATDAGLVVLERAEADGDPHGVFAMLRGRVDQRSFAAWERLSTTPGTEPPSRTYTRVREEMIRAERARVLQIRSEGQVPSTVVREVLGLLDVEESMLDNGSEELECITATGTGGQGCVELQAFGVRETPADPVCDACVREGTHPVALRMCLVCGEIGCCDSSVGRHATAHYETTGHAVMQSAEPGETWRWCYVHSVTA